MCVHWYKSLRCVCETLSKCYHLEVIVAIHEAEERIQTTLLIHAYAAVFNQFK